MDELIEDTIREKVCEENLRRMQTVQKNFRVTRVYSEYFGLAVTVFSFAAMFVWMTRSKQTALWQAGVMADEMGVIYFPWFAVTAVVCPLITVLSFIGDNLVKKGINLAVCFLYLGIILFAVSNFILRFEPMKNYGMFILAGYGLLGLWAQDFSLRSYKELNYLSTQEGFPDFNFNLEQGRYSRYVKYRNKWLRSKKKHDYFSGTAQPVNEYAEIKTDNEHSMDGIAALDSDSALWHENNSPVMGTDAAAADSEMDGIETDGEGITDVAEYDDPRHRPL